MYKKRGIVMTYTSVLYPALVYKNTKNNVFVANCIIKKLIGYGHSEQEAINNLETILNISSKEYPVKVKPVYQFLPELDKNNVPFKIIN